MTQAIVTLRKVLDAFEWDPQPAHGIAGFEIDFGDPHYPVSTALAAIASNERLVFMINLGFIAAESRRDECARFITRANWQLIVGSFEMDYDDGQLRFKSSISFGDEPLTEGLVRNVILPAMTAIETYVEPLADVALRGVSAEEAIASIEDT